jgi:hypothetical protein
LVSATDVDLACWSGFGIGAMLLLEPGKKDVEGQKARPNAETAGLRQGEMCHALREWQISNSIIITGKIIKMQRYQFA